jgi:hypothetical protein
MARSESVEEIENPYRWQTRGALVMTLIGALGFAFMVVPPALPVQNGLLALAIIVGTTFLLAAGLPSLVLYYWRAHESKKEIRDLLAANHLVHWRYNPDEWRRFAETEWAQAKAKARIMPLASLCFFLVIGFLVTLVFSLLFLLGVWDPPLLHQVPIGKAFLIFGGMDVVSMAIIGAVLGVELGAGNYLKERERYRKRLRSPGEAYLGPSGFYMQGLYIPLRWWSRLGPAGIEPGDPAVLRLNVEVPLFRRYRPFRALRVPIPRGKEEEARELVGRLSAQPYGGTAPEKPWSPGNLAFLLLLLLNLQFLLWYVYLPHHISFVAQFRRSDWLMCLLFCSASLWWRNASRFFKRIAALGGVCFGLFGAISEFYGSIQINYLLIALIALAALAQAASIVFLALEIRELRQHRGEALRVRAPQ